jgi:hypothetical protein
LHSRNGLAMGTSRDSATVGRLGRFRTADLYRVKVALSH